MSEREQTLAQVVDGLLESYREYGNINHLAATSLPSRSTVERLLDDLISVIFPGYFGEEKLDEVTAKYFVGERVARIMTTLENACVRAMGSECRGGATPALDAEEVSARAHEHAMGLLRAIPSIRAVLDTDVKAALSGDPAACNSQEVILSYPGVAAVTVHRIAHQLWSLGVPLIPRMMSEVIHSRTGIDIHPGASIGPSFFIDHGTGVVIGETTVIGERVKLYQGVTLGALSVEADTPEAKLKKRHPTVEDDVTIYARATILGGETTIGRGATVGGNVWLTSSVPPGTTVMLDAPSLQFIHNRKGAS